MITQIKEFRLTGYGFIEKVVGMRGSGSMSGRVYLPAEWKGKKIAVILEEPIEEG